MTAPKQGLDRNVGTCIGRKRVLPLAKLGSGHEGQGVVFMFEPLKPITMNIAVKMPKERDME